MALPSSEHVYVSVWSFKLGVLFGDHIPGIALNKKYEDSTLVEDEFGVTTKHVGGRKTGTSPDDLCKKQQQKAVRLNEAILLDLESKGVNISQDFPLIAEGRGLSLHLVTLKRYGDVLGAGHATAQNFMAPIG
ncbi:hypothetical protein BGX26_002498 [Mortierella sp. AD094]|nr:hypothetical protein BGX26_002498 [Mortierella sp. AD094]